MSNHWSDTYIALFGREITTSQRRVIDDEIKAAFPRGLHPGEVTKAVRALSASWEKGSYPPNASDIIAQMKQSRREFMKNKDGKDTCELCRDADGWMEMRTIPNPNGSFSITGTEDRFDIVPVTEQRSIPCRIPCLCDRGQQHAPLWNGTTPLIEIQQEILRINRMGAS